MAARSGDLVLELQRVVPAPPDVVYSAFADASELAQWWGPHGFTIPSLEFDPRVGGRYRIEMQPPVGDAFFLRGEFRAVEPPRQLAFSFVYEQPDPDDVENLVTLGFREFEGSTEISLLQQPFSTESRRELHRVGWSESFDRLEELLSASPADG